MNPPVRVFDIRKATIRSGVLKYIGPRLTSVHNKENKTVLSKFSDKHLKQRRNWD